MSEWLHLKVKARRYGRHDARLAKTVKRKTLTGSCGRSCVGMVMFKEATMRGQWSLAFIGSVIGGATFAGTFCFASNEKEDLSKDPDYREELGVNQFTAPSLDKAFVFLYVLHLIHF